MKRLLLAALALTTFSIQFTQATYQPGSVHYVSTDDEFNQAISSGYLAVIDFHAEHRCPPCRTLAPIINQLAGQYSNVIFVKINVDQASQFNGRFGIRSIPTVIFFKNGAQVARPTKLSRAALSAEINRYQ